MPKPSLPVDVTICLGIPDKARAQAARLYWQSFGRQILPVPVGRAKGEALVAKALRSENVLVALDPAGRLLGMVGLRDASGGVLKGGAASFTAIWPWIGRALYSALGYYRAGPDTSDMVIDGIAVLPQFRGQGLARALIKNAAQQARERGYPGLRAEVASGNQAAIALYLSMGFQPQGQHPVGWPWSGQAQIMHRPLQERSPRSSP